MAIDLLDITTHNSIIGGDVGNWGSKEQIRDGLTEDKINELVAEVNTVNGTTSGLGLKEDKANKGVANGYAELDNNGKVPLSQINDSLIGSVEYIGTYDALTNTPTLSTTPYEKGVYYVINVAGTQFGLEFNIGDWIISNGTSWEKVDNYITAEEIGLGNVDNTSDLTKITVSTFADLETTEKTIVGAINEVNERTGTIRTFDTIADAQDYSEFVEGDRINLLGRISINDGAGHERYFSMIDDGSGEPVVSGGFLNYTINGVVSVKHFGALCNGSDETFVLQKILDFGLKKIEIEIGFNYNYSSLVIDETVILFDKNLGQIIISDMCLEGGKNARGHFLIRNKKTGQAGRVHIEPNGIIRTGTQSKIDLMLDPFEENEEHYRIFNIFTQNGDLFSNGYYGNILINSKSVGDFYGNFQPIIFGFQDVLSNTHSPMKIMFVDKMDTTKYTPNRGNWKEGLAISTNDYIMAMVAGSPPNYVLYKANNSGTTGTTKPTHLNGNASDGNIDWQFVKNYTTVAQAGNFKSMVVFGDRDDTPLQGLDYGVQFLKGFLIDNAKKMAHYYLGTEVASRQNIGNELYDNFKGSTHKMRYTETFIQHQGGATLMAVKNSTDGSTVFDTTLCDTLVFNNTNPTEIVTVNAIQNQRIFVRSTNGNTTLKHSSHIILKGGANLTLTNSQVLLFYATASNVLVQV